MRNIFSFFPHHLFFFCLIGLPPFAASGQVSAEFSADQASDCEQLVVDFTDQSSGPVSSWNWDFGDGNTSTLSDPTHFYSSPGTYTVTLTVSDGTNNDTETKTDHITVFAPPTADLQADNTAGCRPHTVNFTDQSTAGDAPINNWLWDFGDGNTSSQTDPSNTYTSAGSYDINLLVTDTNGCDDQLTLSDHIRVFPLPDADFTVSDSFSCETPLDVDVTNNSTGNDLSYEWDFGDGSTSTSASPPTHTYNSFGTYDLELVAIDSNGCSDTLTRTITLTSFNADFSSDVTQGCPPLTVNFSDASTAGTNSWEWDFGDGNTSTQQNPAHTYNSPGTYSVELVTGNGSCSDTTTKTNYITVHPEPDPGFTVADSGACSTPFTADLTDTTQGSISSRQWDFGDGSPAGSGATPSHSYTSNGDFTVSLTVTNSNGCQATRTRNNLISIVYPQAGATFDVTEGCQPLSVNFSDSTISGNPVTQWDWDFGDGNTASVENPSHTYTDTGAYTITLTIENSEGCQDTIVYPDTIKVGQSPEVSFSPKDTTGCHRFQVEFTDSSSSFADSWYWDFGDGSTSIQQNPSNNYRDTGHFTVTHIAGFKGCTDTLVVDSAVHVLPPKPQFSTPDQTGCDTPHAILFNEDSEGADSWFWKFDDGTTATGPGPITHTYDTLGTFRPELIVENSSTGCKDSITRRIRISKLDLGFSTDTTQGCNPLTINFTDTSSSAPSWDLAEWKWYFGDGDSSSQQNPSHVYQTDGLHDVQLIVRDTIGCRDTLTVNDHIDVKPLPEPGFEADTLTGCAPFDVTFSDTSNGANPLKVWEWDFGNGSPPTNGQDPGHTYASRGQYDVQLTVTDTFQCVDSVTTPNYIQPTYPYPAFGFPDTICDHQTVNFNNNSTGTGLSYSWDFGDGSPSSTTTSPSHSYDLGTDSTVTLPVTLSVTDANGCDSVLIDSVTISKPRAGIAVDSSVADCPPFNVSFQDSSSADATDWLWDFGDSSTTSTTHDPAHVYGDPGYYDVQLIATNAHGCRDTVLEDSLIRVGGPTGTFTDSLLPNTCYKEYLFEATTQNTEQIFWVFGDGSAASGDSVVHEYRKPGDFTPVLILEDTAGCRVNLPRDSSIASPGNDYTADFTRDSVICNGETVSFNSSASTSGLTYAWDFGDSSSVDSTENPSHTYSQWTDTSRTYDVTLFTTDSNGCDTTITKTVTLAKPQAGFSANTTSEDCFPATINFSDTTTGNIAGWTWDFGDSTATGTTADPSHTYTDRGNYSVSLIVTDDHGCKDTLTRPEYISVGGPTGDFTYSVVPGSCSRIYEFSTQTSAEDISWLFDDGTTGTGATTSHEYPAGGGPYLPSMILEDSTGCRDTLPGMQAFSTPTDSLEANFTIDTNHVFDLPITFTDASSGNTSISEWEWVFDDGGSYTDSSGNPVRHEYDEVGRYQPRLIIRNGEGCSDSATTAVTIVEGIFIPNVFTPNGDGKNELFRIRNAGVTYFKLKVFNRWGGVIYTTEGENGSWDGTTLAGKPAPEGTYYYVLEYSLLNSEPQERRGQITLLRGAED